MREFDVLIGKLKLLMSTVNEAPATFLAELLGRIMIYNQVMYRQMDKLARKLQRKQERQHGSQ